MNQTPPQLSASIPDLSATRVQAPARASKKRIRRYREVGDIRLLGNDLARLYLHRRQEAARTFNKERDTNLMTVPVNNRAARRRLVKLDPRIRGLAQIARHVDAEPKELAIEVLGFADLDANREALYLRALDEEAS